MMLDFRGTTAQYELAQSALELLELYSPRASRRVFSQIGSLVAVDMSTEYRTSIKALYLNFDEFGTPISVAVVLLLNASIALVRRRQAMHTSLARGRLPMRVAMGPVRRLVRWWSDSHGAKPSAVSEWEEWMDEVERQSAASRPDDRRKRILAELASVLRCADQRPAPRTPTRPG